VRDVFQQAFRGEARLELVAIEICLQRCDPFVGIVGDEPVELLKLPLPIFQALGAVAPKGRPEGRDGRVDLGRGGVCRRH
jgi:hypothetical protein